MVIQGRVNGKRTQKRPNTRLNQKPAKCKPGNSSPRRPVVNVQANFVNKFKNF